MRKSMYLLVGLLIGLLVGSSSLAFANSPIKLIINDKEITCDVQPQIINGRVMVPARFVAESLGATVSWDSANNAVVVNGAGYVPTSASSNQQATLKSFLTQWGTVAIPAVKIMADSSTTTEQATDSINQCTALINSLEQWYEPAYYTPIKTDIKNQLLKICAGLAIREKIANGELNALVGYSSIVEIQTPISGLTNDITLEIQKLKNNGLL